VGEGYEQDVTQVYTRLNIGLATVARPPEKEGPSKSRLEVTFQSNMCGDVKFQSCFEQSRHCSSDCVVTQHWRANCDDWSSGE